MYSNTRAWDHLRAEVERCRRTGSSFVLVRVSADSPRPTPGRASWRLHRSRTAEVLDHLPRVRIRSVDHYWCAGSDGYFLLVDTPPERAACFVQRLLDGDPSPFERGVVETAAFPVDGLTPTAVMQALRSPAPTAEPSAS